MGFKISGLLSLRVDTERHEALRRCQQGIRLIMLVSYRIEFPAGGTVLVHEIGGRRGSEKLAAIDETQATGQSFALTHNPRLFRNAFNQAVTSTY